MRADNPKSRPYPLRFIVRSVALGLALTALLAAPARAAELPVVVVPGLELADLEALSQEGAVGLLVPDAGPDTSEAHALASLERGKVRNSLLGGAAAGDRIVEAQFAQGPPQGNAIILALPRGGKQRNDRRYPIAVIGPGYHGLLTSTSTRIPGLVSVVDVAPTALGKDDRLGSRESADPVAELVRLDRRIDDNRDAKAAFLLVSLALIVAVAVFLPGAVLAAFSAVLLANLALGIAGATDVWVDVLVLALFVAASLVFVRLPPLAHGLLLGGVIVAYLLAMGIDAEWVAFSPFGPTQNARFYGLSNLLETLLLVPAFAGPYLLGATLGLWAFPPIALLALVAVGGTSFGADGGGVLVLLVGYAVLIATYHRLSWRAAVGGGAAALLVLGLALAVGGHSHVTDAISSGPVGLAEDFWRRLELSWLRATSSWGAGLLVFGGILALALLALRERRPLQLAYLAALAVSLLVNDSPNDVVVAGLAGYLVLSTAPALARPAAQPERPDSPAPRARTAPASSP
jgi:hypothetical protein